MAVNFVDNCFFNGVVLPYFEKLSTKRLLFKQYKIIAIIFTRLPPDSFRNDKSTLY